MSKVNSFKNGRIVVITDCRDNSFDEMYQVLQHDFKSLRVDHFYFIPPVNNQDFPIFSISMGIRSLAEIYPADTTFVVVESDNETSLINIFGKTKSGTTFIGNNSGYFNRLVEDFGLKFLYESSMFRNISRESYKKGWVEFLLTTKIYDNTKWDKIGTPRDVTFLNNA